MEDYLGYRMNDKGLKQAELQRLAVMERRYRNAAKDYFGKRVAFYHQVTGGVYHTITVRDQKSRWGSCSSRGTLSFNYRLMFAPPRVLDYVVVHELCHRRHMNHSAAFWKAVEEVMPDYAQWRKWLKENGRDIPILK